MRFQGRRVMIVVILAAIASMAPSSWGSIIIQDQLRYATTSGSGSAWIRVGDFAPPQTVTDGPYSWSDSATPLTPGAVFDGSASGSLTSSLTTENLNPVVSGQGSAEQHSSLDALEFIATGSVDVSGDIFTQYQPGISYGGSLSAVSDSCFRVFFELTSPYYVTLTGSVYAYNASESVAGLVGIGDMQIAYAVAATSESSPSASVDYSALLNPGVYVVAGQAIATYSSDYPASNVSYNLDLRFCPTVVPEPMSIVLLSVGLGGMVLAQARRRR